MKTYTLASIPAAWLRESRRVLYGPGLRYVGRLDGLWNLRGGFQLRITNRRGTHTTPPLPGDTPIALAPTDPKEKS